jgi:anaerobic selenocysteine-containing dehydrogenase
MPVNFNGALTRRRFLKFSAAATAASVLKRPRVLHALVPSTQAESVKQVQEIFSACDMCFNKCGLIARVEGGVVKKLDPNPKSLKSRGMLCARGNAGIKQLYDPDRLKYPLLRKGARGEGRWQRLSWDAALDHAAEQLDRIGKEYTRCGFLFMAGTDMQSTFVHHFIEDFRKAQLEKLPEVAKALEIDGVYNIVGHSHGIHEGKPFKTRSKKIELFNSRYAEYGIDPIPVYHPPKNVPDNHFRIVVGRNAYITQSASTNNALLWELEQENALWIHPAPAQRLGIRHGDTVEVKSPVGQGRLKARVTEDTRSDTVYMDTGFGVISKGLSKIYGKGACIAEILEDQADNISGNMAMHETIVSVRKV